MISVLSYTVKMPKGLNIMDILEISEYQLYKLKSIDPSLSADWQETISLILPDLNKESQNSIHKNILEPRGIYVDKGKGLIYKRPVTLKKTIKDIQTNNKDLIFIASDMLKIIDSCIEYYDAIQLADEIEAIFSYLDNLDLHNLPKEQKNRKKIRVAFLYDLAQWIDKVNLNVHAGLRGLDAHMVKSYLKEVFIKQKIQGRDFRKWDSSDISFQELTYLPRFIKHEGGKRSFMIVEGLEYWFLIGSADKRGKNPYSFRRFLHEDNTGIDTKKHIYLTHAVIRKYHMNDSQYLAYASYIMSRFYTLDSGVPDTLSRFINEIQKLDKIYLKPLLRKRLEQDGGSTEAIIKERMITYEKQVSVLILGKLPRIIQTTLHNINDQDYLFHNLDQLIKQMIDNLQDFRLQPLAIHSTSSEIMSIKLIALRKLLIKSHNLLCSQEKSTEERTKMMSKPLFKIQEKVNEIDISTKELKELKDNLNDYSQIKEKGTFWEKIKLGRRPNYTIEDITKEKLILQEDIFMSIINLAKNKSQGMVYVEFECDEVINKSYRHYALADGELGISRLPRVLRLPEDRKKFNIETIRETINQNVFESNQPWNIQS